MINFLRVLRNNYKKRYGRLPVYLRGARGVIHVGANDGRERAYYDRARLPVLWVEALPDVFEKLRENLRDYPRQTALNYLLLDEDGQTVAFNVASNNAESSSIFELADHVEIWPEVGFVGKVELTGHTFATMVEREQVDLGRYDSLILDVQGAELLVLKGAERHLAGFRYILAEAADFNCYEGATTLAELETYLAPRGFRLIKTYEFARKEGVGRCCDALFKRIDF